MEIWKPIEGYEGKYEVSDLGRIRSFVLGPEPHFLSPKPNSHGYIRVLLGPGNHVLLHRVVATAFVSNPANKPQVNHRNGVKTDNRVDNLEWATNDENIAHATSILRVMQGAKTHHDTRGEANPHAKLTDQAVREIRTIYAAGKLNQPQLAQRFGVSKTVVNQVVLRKAWSHVM